MSAAGLEAIRLPLAILALALLSASGFAGEVDVDRYEIGVDLRADGIEAKVALHGTVTGPPKTWELRLADTMEIGSLTVNGVAVDAARDGWKLTLDLSSLPQDSAELSLAAVVSGSPRQNVRGMARTIITPEHARIRSQYPWYPRVADDAATYRTTISVRRGWRARTAGRARSETEDGDRRVVVYEGERPVRGIGLAAGPYEVTTSESGGGFVLDAWTLPGDAPGAKVALEFAQRTFESYRARFGEIALSGFSLVEVPADFGPGSGYGEAGYVLLGPGAFSADGKAPWAEELVAHEIAHTWWGTEVGFSRFASESLASYATLGCLGATGGEDVPRRARERAVTAVLDVAAKGKEVAFDDIRPWGAGMDPETYRVHAYDKGMMLLSMVEDAIGTKAVDNALAGLLDANRGKILDWADVRAALVRGGSAARAIVDQWEEPGIPELAAEHTAKESGKSWKVKGTITQTGTPKPFRMRVRIVAVCGAERVEEDVQLKGAKATFSLTTPAEPDALLLDPDWRLLVRAPRTAAKLDPEETIARAFDVVNNPRNRDPAALDATIDLLSRLLAQGAGRAENLCHLGIGRCRFRQGRHEEARESLEAALKAGIRGFHANWARLRLGNIADLAGEREKAREQYRIVAASSNKSSEFQIKLAKRFLETPYRGE